MLYGFQDGTDVIVVAADEKVQFEVFKTGVADSLGGTDVDAFGIMMNPDRYANFKQAILFEFTTQKGADDLVAKTGLSLVPRHQAVDLHAKMNQQAEVDPFDPSNTRTIEEIYQIEGKDDEWDARTDDEKARAQLTINLQAIRDKQDAGEITTESFAPKKGRNGVANVVNIDAHYDDEGNLVIDGVTAEKGLYEHEENDISLEGEGGAGAARPWAPDYDSNNFIRDVADPDAFKALTASEFVFAVAEGDPYGLGQSYAYVRMAPKSYFDAAGKVYENSLWPMVRHLIARDAKEEDEQTFVHQGMSAKAARATYAALGFQEDQAFTDHLNGEVDARAEKAKAKGKAPKNEGRFLDATTPVDANDAVQVKVGQGPEFTDETDARREEEEEAMAGPVEFTIAEGEDVSFLGRFLRGIVQDADGIVGKLIDGGGRFLSIDDHHLASLLALGLRRRYVTFKAVCDDEPWEADEASAKYLAKGPISIFFKVELPGAKIDDIYDIVTNSGQEYDKLVMAAGEDMDGCWVACPVLRVAEKVEFIIRNADPKQMTDVYGINASGERIVPKGVNASVVDEEEEREIGPRLWNAEADKLEGMTEEEAAENDANLKADEFLFTGHEEGRKVIIYITPRSYFEEHGTLWEGELPEAAKRHIPRAFVEVSPGVYSTVMATWSTVANELAKRGMRESMKLRMFLN